MKCLVTGGAGFIGSHLADKLIEQNNEVEIWDNLSTGKKENINKKAIFIKKNIETESVPSKKFDIIFHIAAKTRITPSFLSPYETYQSNVGGTMKILELAKEYNSKFIFASTGSLYGGLYSNPYTFTKGLAEECCKMYNKTYKVNIAIARFFNVYGPRQIEDTNVVGIFNKQKKNKKPLTIIGDGNQKRDFTHVEDIISGLLSISKKNWNCEIFDLGSGVNYSINEIATMFHHEKVYLPAERPPISSNPANIKLTKQKINWNPKNLISNYIKKLNKKI